MHQPHNPVIGYHAYDHDYHIIAPDETSNLVYYSAARALQAASDYGQAQRVSGISPLHLDGILSIIIHDTGDILLDGRATRRFIKACRQRKLPLNQRYLPDIRFTESQPVYSCRHLLTT